VKSSAPRASSSRTPRKASAGVKPERRPPSRREERPKPRPDRARGREGAPQRPRVDLIYGRNAVLEAARAGHVKRVLVADGLDPDPRLDELATLIRVEVVAKERLEGLAHGNHQGVVAELAPREFANLRGLLAANPTLVLGLDGIQDPQNLGAILRTADAAGVDGVVLPERRSAPVTGAVVKASSGASEHVRLVRVSGMASAVSEIKRAGLWCVALDVNGEQAPWEFDLTQPVCLVIGGEEGVHRLVRQRCDARLRIPMAGRVDSLNASAAAAALLYEVMRQRAVRSSLG
jgi:23S rRNA (guanosine2251-2'-O)-methyltransferase